MCLINSIRAAGVDVDEKVLEELKKIYYLEEDADVLLMCKLLTNVFGQYNEQYSDFELWTISNASGYFEGIDVESIHDKITFHELYSIVRGAVDRLNNENAII